MNKSTDELIGRLRRLREVEAPDLRPKVLRRLGLADRYSTIDTPLGPAYVAYNQHGVSALMLAGDDAEFERAFRAEFGRPAYRAEELPEDLRRELIKHLETGRSRLRFDLRGLTPFQQAVLRKVLEIPRGETRPYQWVAQEIDNPRAVRAVGSTVAKNPVALLIPCHRVVRADGTIGNYGLGGPGNKHALLQAEGVRPEEIDGRARYLGSATTKIFCFPTCRHARRVGEAHRRPFRTFGQATGAGYRPCRVCRPA